MLYTGFSWYCPHCKKVNWDDEADEDKPYRCRGCKQEFLISFDVSVSYIEACEEVSTSHSIRLVSVEISKDDGATWETMMINTRDLNPETSPIKAGWLLKYNGVTYKAYIHPTINRLQTEKVK